VRGREESENEEDVTKERKTRIQEEEARDCKGDEEREFIPEFDEHDQEVEKNKERETDTSLTRKVKENK